MNCQWFHFCRVWHFGIFDNSVTVHLRYSVAHSFAYSSLFIVLYSFELIEDGALVFCFFYLCLLFCFPRFDLFERFCMLAVFRYFQLRGARVILFGLPFNSGYSIFVTVFIYLYRFFYVWGSVATLFLHQ